ncbi:hypothetical protein AMJ82_06770 [candidate division TA06 bacterium SM23_40]|uniref:Uncharacterized protein n=1 Tax=candidate division TA06 bacterium SM23_40 TaxID=1703774 RepID=A0A0S8G7I4_UNCT6|nr:MAG: hypothetical protein AMJ82_06770 [candidate division TA06 bacterium SM23_40]
MMRRSIFLTGLMAVMLVSLAYAASAVKVAPVTEDRCAEPGQVTPADFCDPLWAWDMEAQTGDNHILGNEWKWGYHWVTGGNSGLDPNYIYQYDDVGNLVGTYQQMAGSNGWGLRDLAEDEDYIYGSFSMNLDAYDEFGNYVTSIPGPENPNRALARDPDTGVWWTGDFYDPIYSFTSPPLVVLTTTPVALVYTGVSCTVNSGIPSSVAGGCCFDEATGDIYGIIQGTPDHLFAVDITEGCAGDTAYCKVTDVSTDAEYYLPGDVIELTVNWKYVDTGPWGMSNTFLVGGGLGREPAGHPRFIQNTMVGPVGPGSYTELFYFTVPMATPLGTEVGGGGHCWPDWSGPGQPEQSIYIEHNLCIIDVYMPPEFLIWELDMTPISGQPIADVLTAMGHTHEFVVNLGDWNLPDHMGLFVLMGIYPNSGFIAAGAPEALQIEAYIAAGGKVYAEGGDFWYYDPMVGGHDFGPAFGIMAVGDGGSDLFTVNGVANTLMPGLGGLVSPYFGENSWIDELSPIPPAELVFQNPDNMDQIGIANFGTGKTLGTSFELGGTDFLADVVMEFVAF